MADQKDHEKTSGVVFPPPFYYLIGILAGFGLGRIYPLSLVSAGYVLVTQLVSIVLAILAFLLVVSALVDFRRAGTSPIPHRPTTALVTRGPYRFTRNPMYLAFAFVGFALALYFNTAWVVIGNALAMLFVDRLVIAKEEPYLEEKFGDAYLEYKRHVRRWF